MRIVLEPFVLSSVKTGISKNEEVVTYIEGVEVGGYMVSARVVGKAYEPDLKPYLGNSLSLILDGVDFLSRDGRTLSVRCSNVFFELVNQT